MAKRSAPNRGRNATLLPPLPPDFAANLSALLRTPPPPKDDKPAKPKTRKAVRKKVR